MISKVLLIIFLLNPILSLKCSISLLPYVLNYSLTTDNIPSFDDNSLIDIQGECTLTIRWLKNPLSTMIVFGYNIISNKSINSIDSILARVQYELEGEELSKRLSHDVEFKCQSLNECNNEKNLKQILKSIKINEYFSEHFNNLILSNKSFNNESIKKCYFNLNSSNECSPIDYINCRRCQITVDLISSLITHICATCPTITNDNNLIVRNKIFILNNRSEVIDRIQLLCQIGEHCNSIENIQQIQQFSFIDFDFEKYFSSSSSRILFSLTIQWIILFLFCFSNK